MEKPVRTRYYWKWEIAATLGNLLCLALMVVLLRVYDGNPIFKWHHVTLNAIISLLSTLGRAALLFTVSEAIAQWKWIMFAKEARPLLDLEKVDSGSRGLFGGFKLLWPGHRTAILPLGALILVFALALDPFAQQLLQYSPGMVWLDDTQATISLAKKYSKGNRIGPFNVLRGPGGMEVGTTFRTDFAIQSAILYGLVTGIEAVEQQTSFNCRSGNCTWDPFESLAVCSRCSNVTNKIVNYQDDNFLWMVLPDDIQAAAASLQINPNGTTFLLPNGLLINEPDYEDPQTFDPDTYNVVSMTAFSTGNASMTVDLQDVDNLIWAVTMLSLRNSNGSSFAWPDSAVEALECGLYYCIKQYSSNVTNGKLFEQEESLAIGRNPDSWMPADETALNETRTLNWTASDFQSLDFSNLSSNVLRTDLMFGNQFNLSQVAVESISQYFHETFATENLGPVQITVSNRTRDLGLINLNGWVAAGDYRPDVMQVYHNSPNLSSTFDAIAKSMSNTLRAGADNGTTLQGKSGTPEIVYKVEWPWIVLHVALFLAGLFFLTASIYETSQLKVPVWKSSCLPLLALDTEVRHSLAGVETLDEMEKRASEHFVQLWRKNQ